MNQPSRFSNHFKSIAASLACLSILFLLAHGEALRTVQRALAGNAAVTTAAPKRNAAISHVTASAQTGGSFTLSETVIAGGGGYSSGGAFALQSTSGQSLAAISTGGAFSYESGFGNGVLSASMSCVATLTVNDAGDGADVTPGDGVCETATGNGICTLRAAIEETNALTACGAITINFNIPGGGVKTIAPTREFPIITHTVTLDATTQPGAGCTTQGGLKIELNGANAGANAFGLTLHGGNSTVKGFVINRFAVGLYLETAGNNRVQCNYLGTDVAGLADLGNGQHGVVIREIPNNTIGGTGTGERNIISGNDLTGVFISGAAATGNIVSGNYIGVAVDGTTALGNSGTGVHLTSAPSNRIEGNLIIGNGYLGVSIIGTATGNAILGNAIFNNADLGIDLDSNGVTPNDAGDGDTGPNNLQNFPVLSYASSAANAGGTTNIQGTLNSPAATSFRIEFFVNDACNASGYGEGQSFLGFQNVTTNGNGDATINFTVAQTIALGKLITATATRLDNLNNPVETSEFSACRAVTVPALSYNSVTVAAGAGTTNPPTAANNISGYAVQSQGTFTGTVTVNAAGVVSISNAAPVGTHTITISGMGTSGIVSATFTLTVTCPTITINPATLPNVTSGVAYTQQLTGSGGAGAYNFTVSNGALPTGLQLSPTGLLSGTPTVLGPSSFTITAVDANNCRGSVSYSFNVICPTITVNPAMLPAATLGVAYNQTLTATGASGNYSFSVSAGTLPPGLSLSSTGALTGTPSALGNFSFTVRATSANNCTGERQYTLNLACGTVTVDPATLPSGTIGTVYTQTITTTPAAGGYSFAVTSGTLPMGLMLNAGSGIISGTPTGSGTFNFTITATGACSASRSYTVTIGCATIAVTTTSLPNAAAGVAYNQSISVTPAGNYTFSLSQGNLPSGLTLNSATGVISGLPASTGVANFIIKAQAANGCFATQSYTLTIGCPTIAINPATLPAGTIGTAYGQTFSAAPAGGNYTYAVTGNLPAGLSLNAVTGLLSGTPSASGTFNFTIRATGFGSCASAATAYSITIGSGGCPTITPADLPSGQPGQLYNSSVAASPAGSYTYAVTSGSLPPGLALFGSFGLIYGYPTTAGTFNFTITATDANNCTGAKDYSLLIGGTITHSLVFGDFDGDGKADLSVWRGTSGEWLTINSQDNKAQGRVWGNGTAPYFDVMVPGDYDGDGKMDLAVFRRATGEWFIKGSKDGAVATRLWGLGTDIPVPGDYDGDGKTDIAVWRGSDTNWYIIRSSDGQIQTTPWGTSKAPYNDVPVAADFDGDGKTDVAVFRRANGHWYIKLSSDGSVIDKAWGLSTDVPVVADYDGDGKADIAVWRGSDTNWYIVRSSDGMTQAVSWGTAALKDIPVPGDYDGDGKADVAVWRENYGSWYIKSSRDGSAIAKVHGTTGDWPVTGR